jgi:hypothetical protein
MNPYSTWVRRGADLLSGDLVRHTNSGRMGAVLGVVPWRDGSVECEVRIIAPNSDEHLALRQWSSIHLERMSPDPYRRYLAMCTAEDAAGSADVRARRSRQAQQRAGYLPAAAWAQMYWQIGNWRRLVADAVVLPRQRWYSGINLGRDAWDDACLDCLHRRSRSTSAELGCPGQTSRQ